MYAGISAKRYQPDLQQVIDGESGLGSIYIGNKEASEDLALLSRLGIKAVLTAARGIRLNHPESAVPLYKYIPADDSESFDLSPFFEQASEFISQARNKGNILVHCMAGVSRSVSLVIAYLIGRKGHSYEDAYSRVKSRRSIIHPNDGFINQLKKYAVKVKSGIPSRSQSLVGDSLLKLRTPYQHLQRSIQQRLRQLRNNSPSKQRAEQDLLISQSRARIQTSKRASQISSNSNSYLDVLMRKYEVDPRRTEIVTKENVGLGLSRGRPDYSYLAGSRMRPETTTQWLGRSSIRQTRGEDISARIDQLRKRYLPDSSFRGRATSSVLRY